MDHFCHDDTEHIFKYKSPRRVSNNPPCTLTVPLGSNELFQFRTNDGYTSFMAQASHYCREFEHFAGAGHLIPDNNTSSNSSPSVHSSHDNPRDFVTSLPVHQSHDKPREPRFLSKEPPIKRMKLFDKTRQIQPISIPHTDSDFSPIKQSSLLSPFCSEVSLAALQDDPTIAAYRC